MRLIRWGFLGVILLCSVACEETEEDKILEVMKDYVGAINSKNTDDMLDVVYEPVFEYVSKQELAFAIMHDRRRKVRVKKLKKVYGPYEADGKEFVLAEFEFKNKGLFGRSGIQPYIFVKPNDKWYIIPYPLRHTHHFFHFDNIERIEGGLLGKSGRLEVVPESVLKQMSEEYIPGSER